MLHHKWFARTLSIVLCALMSVPVVAVEASVSALDTNRQVLDLQLGEHGSFLGKLVDRQGQGLANVDVQILTKHAVVASVKTNDEGIFKAQGLNAGEMAVRVGGLTQMVRVWNPDMAPPAASHGALFVVGDAVRGQCCPQPVCTETCAPACGGCGNCNECGTSGGGLFGGGHGGGFGGHFGGGGLAHGLLTKPWLLGAGVAAAIAIPLALDDDDAS